MTKRPGLTMADIGGLLAALFHAAVIAVGAGALLYAVGWGLIQFLSGS